MELIDALRNLDPLDDDHWTQSDDPRIDVVSRLVGRTVSRQEIIDASPGFSRTSPIASKREEKPEEKLALQEFLSADVTAQRFLNYLGSIPSEELEATIGVLSEMLEDVEDRLRRGADLKREIKQCIGLTRARVAREIPEVSNQEAIRAYITRQAESRGVRFEKVREVRKIVDLKTLDPRAPIDAAMARNTKRGTKRPIR